MAISVRPADGLVTRLLQQQTSNSNTSSKTTEAKNNTSDQVTISQQARQQTSDEPSNFSATNPFGQRQDKLESQLIRLYAQHSQPEPKS